MIENVYDEKFVCKFRSKRTLNVQGKEERIQGQFLMTWPYAQTLAPPMDADFQPAVDAVFAWKAKYLPKCNTARMHNWIEVGTQMGYCLAQWLLDSNRGFQKMVCFSEFIVLNLIHDDFLEEHAVRDYYPHLVFHCIRCINLIGEDKYADIPDLEAADSYKVVMGYEPGLAEYLQLLHHWYREFYAEYDVTVEDTYWLRMEYHQCFEVMSWCGSKNFDHQKCPLIWEQFRAKNGGAFLCFELLFLLFGLKIGPEIRGNVYWQQVNLRGSWLTCYINDLFSFEKEWIEYQKSGHAVDNQIQLEMWRSKDCSFDQAVQKVCEYHDMALSEFRNMVCFLNQNPRYTTEKEELRGDFYKSLECVARFCFCNIQFHQLSRYAQFDLTMEKDGDCKLLQAQYNIGEKGHAIGLH